jgi:hypothetical protein
MIGEKPGDGTPNMKIIRLESVLLLNRKSLMNNLAVAQYLTNPVKYFVNRSNPVYAFEFILAFIEMRYRRSFFNYIL